MAEEKEIISQNQNAVKELSVVDAVKELRDDKKRKFVQTVDLIINLKDFDVRKQGINTFIKVPNPTEKKIGAFLSKRSKIVDTITKEDFSKYKESKDIKKLAKKYDFFIAAAPMMGQIATNFGRVFGPMNKMPSPQAGIMPVESDDALKEMVDKMQKLIRVKTSDLSLKIPIGKEDMSDEEIKENTEAVVRAVENSLPLKNGNVKNVMIKFTMTKPRRVKV